MFIFGYLKMLFLISKISEKRRERREKRYPK